MKSQIKKHLLTLLGTLALAVPAIAAPQVSNVRDVNCELDPSKIVPPESFEVDTHNLMTNWYLQRYAVLDTLADTRASVELTDEEYIARLQKMPTSIEMPFNPIVRSFIKMYVERKKGLVEAMLGLSLYYMPIFEEALDKYGLPLELRNLAIIESALNPNAVSRAGATGLWQFMTPTAQGEGLEINSLVDERRDPYRSSDAAARYLKKLYDSYGDWSLAIAAYNCGPGNVNKAMRRAGGGKKDFWEIYRFLPAETRDYIPAFIAANYAMTYFKEHNISPVLASKPIVVDSVHVTRRVHFQQISDVLGIPMDELRVLNPQYRTDLIPGDIKPYALVLPNLQTINYVVNEDSIVNHNAELYVRRDIVLPATSTKITDENGGEYIEETVVKYHKVKKNENVASVARKYGVTRAEVIRANGGRKTLRRGTTLKINSIQRRFVPSQTPDSTAVNTQNPDSIPVEIINETEIVVADENENVNKVEEADEIKTTPKSRNAAAKSNQSSTSTQSSRHTVRKGENLYKIATKYGISVDALKKANNLTNDNINAGQTLTIPAKKTTSRHRKK